jgi:integrase
MQRGNNGVIDSEVGVVSGSLHTPPSHESKQCADDYLPSDRATIPSATPLTTGGRGPVVKRRFQRGCFQLKNGLAYLFFYEDARRADGSQTSRKVRHFIGKVGPGAMSERSARREQARIMLEVNNKRGSVAPAVIGSTFGDITEAWRLAIAPHLAPSTLRQRESHLRRHILPKFEGEAPHSLDVQTLQQFATELRRTLSRKSVVHVLTTIFGIQDYAGKCGTLVSKVKLVDLELGSSNEQPDVPFFTREQAVQIIEAAKDPYRSIFAMAWSTGLRAGEILALTVADLDFERKTIRVNKSSDDNTRQIRQPKTKCSSALLPMPSALEAVLRKYLDCSWRQNVPGLLFPNRKGTKPLWRDNVVKYQLQPILERLGLPTHNVGLHAFRHGLATELADAAVPLPVLQKQLRHADVKTTLRIYARAIPASQREAMERICPMFSTNVLNAGLPVN